MHGFMKITAQAFGWQQRAQVTPGHSRYLGRAEPGQTCPTWRPSGDCRCWAGPSHIPKNMIRLHSWMEIIVQAFGSWHRTQVTPGHSGSLGGVQSVLRTCPKVLWWFRMLSRVLPMGAIVQNFPHALWVTSCTFSSLDSIDVAGCGPVRPSETSCVSSCDLGPWVVSTHWEQWSKSSLVCLESPCAYWALEMESLI